MKNLKKNVLLVATIVASLFTLTGCFKHSYKSPCDYPNSKWVYTGEFGTIDLYIPSTPGQYRGEIERDGEKKYIFYSFDSLTRSIFIDQITEEEFFGKINIIDDNNLLLRGSFITTSQKFVITSSHYSAFFGGRGDAWSNDKNEKIKLVFERVE